MTNGIYVAVERKLIISEFFFILKEQQQSEYFYNFLDIACGVNNILSGYKCSPRYPEMIISLVNNKEVNIRVRYFTSFQETRESLP